MYVFKCVDVSPKEEDLKIELGTFWERLGFVDEVGASDGQASWKKRRYIETTK